MIIILLVTLCGVTPFLITDYEVVRITHTQNSNNLYYSGVKISDYLNAASSSLLTLFIQLCLVGQIPSRYPKWPPRLVVINKVWGFLSNSSYGIAEVCTVMENIIIVTEGLYIYILHDSIHVIGSFIVFLCGLNIDSKGHILHSGSHVY